MILVTGHRGFIGSYLMKEIPALGRDLIEGDDILNCELPEVDTVIHLAAQAGVINSVENPFETIRTNTLGTVRLAEKYKDKRFIFASTGGAIQERIESPYGLSKLAAEDLIKMICTDYVILRFANIYGTGSRSVVDKFINEDITIYGDGSATRTYVHIDDLIGGILDSIYWPKGSYFFGSDQNYTVKQLAVATGKPIKYADCRPGELKYSSLENTTFGWVSKKNVIEYIKCAI